MIFLTCFIFSIIAGCVWQTPIGFLLLVSFAATKEHIYQYRSQKPIYILGVAIICFWYIWDESNFLLWGLISLAIHFGYSYIILWPTRIRAPLQV